MAQEHVKGLLSTGEVVLIDTRQHWMALVRFALKPILLMLLAAGLVLLNQWVQFDGFLDILNQLIHIVLVVSILIAIVWLPIDVVRWRSRHFVLTNRRSMRMDGVFRKRSFDSSLEQINDIGFTQSVIGRTLGYADLTLLTASEAANESYQQLMDGLQFKRAVLDAKEAIRVGRPLEGLIAGFIVKGGTNLASMRADGKLEQAAAADAGAPQAGDPAAAGQMESVSAEVLAQRSDPGSGGDAQMPPPSRAAMAPPPPPPPPVASAPASMPSEPSATPDGSPFAAPETSAFDDQTPSSAAVDPWGAAATAPASDADTTASPSDDEMAAAEDTAAREAAAWPAADTAPASPDSDTSSGDDPTKI